MTLTEPVWYGYSPTKITLALYTWPVEFGAFAVTIPVKFLRLTCLCMASQGDRMSKRPALLW